MAVQFVVSNLGGERVCEVAGELAWTGRQLKLAVEEATGATLLVCQQELSIGPSRVADTAVLGDLVAAADLGAGRPVQVSYLKREDPRILRDCADRRRLSQSLLAFEGAPTRLVFCCGRALAVDIACTEEHDEGQLRVLPMRAAEDLGFLPLSVFGIAEADVSAILCLAGAFELTGSGDMLEFAFQLTCGDVVGGIVWMCEVTMCTTRLPISVSVSHRAACVAHLIEAMPQLLGARWDAAPGPLHITVDLARLDHQYPTTLLEQRVRGEPPEEILSGLDDALDPAISEVSRRLCQHLRVPKDMHNEIVRAEGIHHRIVTAMIEVNTPPGGKGGGKAPLGQGSSGLTWGELVEAMRAKLPKTGKAYYETTLGRVAALAEAGARPTIDEFNSAVLASCRAIEDLVLGGKKAVNYDEWVRDRAAAARAATAARDGGRRAMRLAGRSDRPGRAAASQ